MAAKNRTMLFLIQIFVFVNIVNGMCTRDCSGIADGSYPYCDACNMYVTCTLNKPTITECMSGTIYDTISSQCNQPGLSKCGADVVCTIDCGSLPDGVYPHCYNCSQVVVCNGEQPTVVPCPPGESFDVHSQICRLTEDATCGTSSINLQPLTTLPVTLPTDSPTTSPTTMPSTLFTDDEPSTSPTTAPTDTGALGANVESVVQYRCIWNCEGLMDGDYQSCNGCNVYATCSNGFIFDNRPCSAANLWDDNLKRCEAESSTCISTDENAFETNALGEALGENGMGENGIVENGYPYYGPYTLP